MIFKFLKVIHGFFMVENIFKIFKIFNPNIYYKNFFLLVLSNIYYKLINKKVLNLVHNVLSIYLLIFFSLFDYIYFCNNFNNSLKNYKVLKLTYFAYCPISIWETKTNMPQDPPSQWPILRLWTMITRLKQ